MLVTRDGLYNIIPNKGIKQLFCIAVTQEQPQIVKQSATAGAFARKGSAADSATGALTHVSYV